MPMYKSNFNPYFSANNPKKIVAGNPTNCVIIKAIINSDDYLNSNAFEKVYQESQNHKFS